MQHVIQYQLFDVAYTNAAKSYDLQSKISDIFNNKLMAGMEALFDELVPGNTVLSLSEVNIDVGSITYSMLDHSLVDRILAELAREIKYRITLGQGVTENLTDGQEAVKSLETNYTDLLAHFLLTGTIPWWATGELMLDPLRVMEQLLNNDAIGLKVLIERVGQHHYVRQRLVLQFPDEVIRQIISLLEPAEAEFIFNYHATAAKVHSEDKLVTSAADSEFEKALWLFILTYLLVDRGSLFNQRSFVKSTLGQMAHHYNRQYAELLSLLTIALNSENLYAGQRGYLPLIIRELSVEEAGISYQNQNNNNLKSKHQDTELLNDDIEIIKHFLVFGSLPWWAEPYNADQVEEIFIVLIGAAPRVLRKLILSAGQNEGVRKRIVKTFDDSTIARIIELLEPVNAPFIINYVADVQQLHTKKVTVGADSRDFKKTVWQFVLDFLIVERGSEFNQRMFLQSNIKKLASNYNIQYRDMLSYFVQSISQLHQSSVAHAPLFKLLTILLHDDRRGGGNIADGDLGETLATTTKTEDVQGAVVLKDVLLYWLRYGVIPWWGKEYFEQSPADMFGLLLKKLPDDVLLIIKFAATDAAMQQRITYQLPADLIIAIFNNIPQGVHAVQLYQYLLDALTTVEQLNKGSLQQTQKLLVLALWDAFKILDYGSFDTAGFMRAVASHLSQHYNMQPGEMIAAVKSKLSKADQKRYSNVFEQIINEAPRGTPISFSDSADIFALIDAFIAEGNIVTDDVLKAEALKIVTWFLANNKLPVQFKGSNPAYVNAVIRQLLEFLNHTNRAGLKQLLESNDRTDLYKLIETETNAPKIDGGIEQLIGAYLAKDKPTNAEALFNEAIRILAYFLANARLPEYLVNVDIYLTLRQLLVLLNYQNKAALISLLQKGGHSVSASIQLHNAFASPVNTAENNVNNTLKLFFEEDALFYLKQITNTSTATDDKFAVLLASYFAHPQQNADFLLALVKQQAIDKYIALNYTDDVVYSLLSHQSSLIGGTGNLDWVKQLRAFFSAGFTDTLLRDRFNNLFREFNLFILGGHILADSPETYLKALFGFLASANNELFLHVSKSISSANAGMVSGLKWPIVLEQIAIRHEQDNVMNEMKKKLNNADKQALKTVVDLDDNTSTGNVEKDAVVNTKDTIYINNAGLVLLNPFFATYFIRLGMMEGGKFINTEIQHRAVHLLQYLVDGAEQTPERALVLNKILCNVPVVEPIPIGIHITEIEKQVSADLLKAVTERWEKMRNTSIPGFQTSFLQRTGALVFKDDAWNLRVEQRGYDVLLQTLPWNIGMIKTPWMDNFLYVEWT
jgi:hypothetical protein